MSSILGDAAFTLEDDLAESCSHEYRVNALLHRQNPLLGFSRATPAFVNFYCGLMMVWCGLNMYPVEVRGPYISSKLSTSHLCRLQFF